jgi:hypothetical protein
VRGNPEGKWSHDMYSGRFIFQTKLELFVIGKCFGSGFVESGSRVLMTNKGKWSHGMYSGRFSFFFRQN